MHSNIFKELSQVDRIVVSADVLRVDDTHADPVRNPQGKNIEMIHALFGVMLGEIMGLPAEPLRLDGPHDGHDRLGLYRDAGVEFSTAGWASIYHHLPEAIAAPLARRFENALAILFEASPAMLALLEARGVPYLNLCVHPVRFLEDYIFNIETGIPELADWLDAHVVPPGRIRRAARVLSARGRRRADGAEPALDGAVVFFGQMPTDASLIADGRMATRAEVDIALQTLIAEHGRVYYRPHPHSNDHDWVHALARGDERLSVIETNSYDLLGSGRLALAAALSSSILHEAERFGVPTRRFLPEPARPNHRRPMAAHVLDEDFWRAALAGDDFAPGPDSARLSDGLVRKALDMAWSP